MKSILLTVVILLFFVCRIKAQEPDWNKYNNISDRLKAIQQYGNDCIKKQQFSAAVSAFITGVTTARRATLDSFVCSNLVSLGVAYRYGSKFDSSLQCLFEARSIADKKNYTILKAMTEIEFYGTYTRMGKSDSTAVTIIRLKDMLPLLDSNGRETAKIEMYLGHNTRHKANYTEALAHYYRALRSFTYLNDSLNEGNIYISLAMTFVNLNQDDKALRYHQQAAKLFTLMGRKYELANELVNITDMYYTSNRLDSAEIAVQKALEIGKELNDKAVMAYAYLHLGNIYNYRQKFPEAEKYFLQSIHICESSGIENTLGEANEGLGQMYMAQHQPLKAAPYLEKHFLLAKQAKDNGEIIEGLLNMAQNEHALHHYEKAYQYQLSYSSYKDSVYSESAAKNMAEMDAKYQADKKEKEIVLLKKDQQLNLVKLQKQKAFQYGAIVFLAMLLLIGFLVINRYRVVQRSKRLIAMERMRNNIARDLHDDIGSTLTSINILSKVALQQKEQTGNLMETSMQKIKDRSSAIMESMGDIVWAINPQNDSFEQMIFRMKEFTAEILDPLNISYHFKEAGNFSTIKLDIKKRKDFYLLFKEAVNNAAKYSNCKNLNIVIEQDMQQLHLKVSDDGIGFNENVIKNGNGLVNMRERAMAMNGKINIESVIGDGTVIRVHVPIT
ncbi:MAG: tetratricopeptide repeat protein [Ferruginibacter sp.]